DWLLVPAANAGQALIISSASHLVLNRWTAPGAVALGDVLLLMAVAAGFVLYQAFWVAMVAHLARRVPLRSVEVWDANLLLSEGVLLCLGAIVALLWRVHPALLGLVMTPVAFAYHMLRGVQLIRLGELDGKTGLYNSHRFEEQFERELARARLLRRPLALVFLDLDFLRDINNTYGHLAGDCVIQEVARRIQENLRQQDFAARFGGEEFVMLLPGTDVTEAHWIAERVRSSVADTPFDIGDGQQIPCSISGGVAAFPAYGRSLSELTAQADAALYRAKRLGRNRVCTAAEAAEGAGAPAPTAPATPKNEPARSAAEPRSLPARTHLPPEARTAPGSSRARQSAYEYALLVLGVLALVASFLIDRIHLGPELFITLCLLGFIAEYWRVDLVCDGQGQQTVSLGVAVTMAAAATLGSLAAVSVNLINFTAFVLQAKRRRFQTLAGNLAVMVVCAVMANLPFSLVRPWSNGFDLWFIGAVLVGSTLYFVTNAGLVSLLVSRRQGLPPGTIWRQQFGWLAPSFIFTAVCGGLMGMAYLNMGWPALPVFVLPLLIMRQTYKAHMRRSREAFETAERGRQALEEAHRLQGRSMEQLIEVVSTIIDARDASVSGHSQQVARYAVAIAREIGLPESEVAAIRHGALLHDLGKVGIPEAILHKPAKLTEEEWVVMKAHTHIGERILWQVEGLQATARIVGEHHERYNGKGYPSGLKQQEIALGARIVALADALDSILSDRPYSRAKGLVWAMEEIERCSGEHFDPAVVAAFRRVVAAQGTGFFVNSAKEGGASPVTEVACAQQA
ncbi:MAG TPA: diguanylate cyclase, partial [Symbiobacteriaceae bacterium]|nr:diguanylate cyclase [Symbiobacteriaceae bacterium]